MGKWFDKFGVDLPDTESELNVRLFLIGHNIERNGYTLADHYLWILPFLWDRGEEPMIRRNPWLDRMVHAACENDYLAVAGCASSGKSRGYAAFGLVFWMARPRSSTVIYTSTSLKDSQRRIWGDVLELWDALPTDEIGIMPGRVMPSDGLIVYSEDGGPVKGGVKSGLQLVACGQGEERNATKKFNGVKNKRVLLVADELPDLVHGLLTAATGNLRVNARKEGGMFKMVGIGNPAGKLDPLGLLMQPKEGWQSVDEDVEEYETKLGWCVRFDVEKSPLITDPKLRKDPVLSFLPTRESIDEDRANTPDAEWWRMHRAWFAKQGETDACYTDDELVLSQDQYQGKWEGETRVYAGIDPAYRSGGDGITVTLGRLGTNAEGVHHLDVFLQEDLEVPSDGNALMDMTTGMVDLLRKHGVRPQDVAIDATSGGKLVADMVEIVWEQKGLHRVEFSGPASARPCGVRNRPANTQWGSRVAELWLSSKDLFRAGQIHGVPPKAVDEMTKRKRMAGKVVKHPVYGSCSLEDVEAKIKVKRRIKRSPDHADSFFVLMAGVTEKGGMKLSKEHQLSSVIRKRREEDGEDVIDNRLRPAMELETLGSL
jgi:hypothetical protein